MSRNFQTHYQALSTVYDEDDEEQEEAPADNIIQIIPDHSKCIHFSHFEGIIGLLCILNKARDAPLAYN